MDTIELFSEPIGSWYTHFDSVTPSIMEFFFKLAKLCNRLEEIIQDHKRVIVIPSLLLENKKLWKDIVRFDKKTGWYAGNNWWERICKRLSQIQDSLFYFDDF